MENDDRIIVDRVRAGEHDAFAVIVDKYHRPIFNTVLRLVGDYDDAVEVTQQAFVAAYERLETYDPAYRFFSWLYRIAYNAALNHIRRGKRTVKLETVNPASASNPETALARSERDEFLHRALQAVDIDHRVVLILRHFIGFPYREITRILDIPESTLKFRLHVARRKLRERLIDLGYFR